MNHFKIIPQLVCSFLLLCLPVDLGAQETSEPTSAASPEEDTLNPVKPVRPDSALPRSRYPLNDKSRMQQLAAYLPQDGMVWVEHYPEPFLAYWQPDRSGLPRGALLILHDEGATPVWQSTTRPLHETLPDYGWATFALALPEFKAKPIPKRSFPVKTKPIDLSLEETPDGEDTTAATAPVSAPAVEPKTMNSVDEGSASVVPAPEVIEQRLESALRFLHDKGQFNIIIAGSGVNAIIAQKFIDKITPKIENPQLRGQLEKPIGALILINSRNRLPTEEEAFNSWFSDNELPVLDIYFKQNTHNVHDAHKRKRLAKKKGLRAYQQVAINEVSGERVWGENRLSRRIRSFLDKNVSGVEVRGVNVAK